VTSYLLAFAVVLLCNTVPAFAPPTWMVLVFFTLHKDLNAPVLIVLGILGAAAGRYLLALGFRKYRHLLPRWYLTNMENAASQITHSTKHVAALAALFFVSPLSSAQLFEAAGIMTRVPLRPLVLAFAAGRSVTYSVYVLGAHAVQTTSIGEIITRNLTSPRGIALQVVMVCALVGLGAVRWKPHPSHVPTNT
jgi:hypothetical protein